jgi:hypothetical protein
MPQHEVVIMVVYGRGKVLSVRVIEGTKGTARIEWDSILVIGNDDNMRQAQWAWDDVSMRDGMDVIEGAEGNGQGLSEKEESSSSSSATMTTHVTGNAEIVAGCWAWCGLPTNNTHVTERASESPPRLMRILRDVYSILEVEVFTIIASMWHLGFPG